MTKGKLITLAVNGGVGFGAKLTSKQLMVLAKHIGEDSEVELTTFQQLYIDVPESKVDTVVADLENNGFSCYPVGMYVKSLRTCNFCKGAEEEGMPVAIELNKRIAGREVPFPVRPAYTGCQNACGEPLMNDIGVIKNKDHYDLYIGGKAKGVDAKIAKLFKSQLSPEDLFTTIDDILAAYQQQGKKREHFAKFIDRVGFNQLLQEVEEGLEKR
ncbi:MULTISPECIES: nitrite reductase [Bacillaceae]|uniref:nitrite reductase n=1 Tax=Bacillaceae TaxID=186817 RepID=UPI002A16B496|nr:nitrite reductase [Cytobacillus sp. IB215316]MDX8362967.1 nitrite reductase [Cytobacillus sp. IB215316]